MGGCGKKQKGRYKRGQGNFGGNGYVNYLDHGNGFSGFIDVKNLSNYML